MQNSISLFKACLIVASAFLAMTFGMQSFAAGDDTAALIAKIKDRKISLVDGIAQSEKQYGPAISAKFELEDGALSLSVYNAKEGLGKDAEHNVLTEAAGDPTKVPWSSKIEVFEDKKHLTRSAMQLTLVQMAKVGLVEAVKKTSGRGTVYSVTPAMSGKTVVYVVLVATPQGKSAKYSVDAQTGKVSDLH